MVKLLPIPYHTTLCEELHRVIDFNIRRTACPAIDILPSQTQGQRYNIPFAPTQLTPFKKLVYFLLLK